MKTYYASRFARNLTSIIRRHEKCYIKNRATGSTAVMVPYDEYHKLKKIA